MKPKRTSETIRKPSPAGAAHESPAPPESAEPDLSVEAPPLVWLHKSRYTKAKPGDDHVGV